MGIKPRTRIDLSVVRKRPGMYVGDTKDGSGLLHLLWEVVANSLDQHLSGSADQIEVTLHDDHRVMVTDNGPGIPLEPRLRGKTFLEQVFTELHQTPTRDGHSPHTHVGPIGVGLAPVNAVCQDLKVETSRNGARWSQAYVRARPEGGLSRSDAGTTMGTTITFLADRAIFRDTQLGVDLIRQRLGELSRLCPTLSITLRDDSGFIVPLRTENGLAGLLADRRTSLAAVTTSEVVGIDTTVGPTQVFAALEWRETGSPMLWSFVNTQPTHGGGSHEQGLLAGLTAIAREQTGATYSKARAAIECGLQGVLHVITDGTPAVAGPCRDRLEDSVVQQTVKQGVLDALHKTPRSLAELLKDRLAE